MASMQRQPSQRRSSPEHHREGTQASQTTQPTRSKSEDSGTFVFDHPKKDSPNNEEENGQTGNKQEQARHEPQAVAAAANDDDVDKCWICFSDSTEDTTGSSPWRSPCPCALVAHERCLLDWIADTEAPNNARRGGSLVAPQILCPQCKAEIKLARPRNYVVDLVKVFDRIGARLAVPGSLAIFSTDMLYRMSFAHGMYSIYRIFGADDARRILGPVISGSPHVPVDFDLTAPEIKEIALATLGHYVQHWRIYVGLPLIPSCLLLSRTNWPFSEAFLTVIPPIFLALQPTLTKDTYDLGLWPPSASMAFGLLPCVRLTYNMYYERVWGAKERRWRQEILPPTSQAQSEEVGNEDPARAIEEAVAEDDNVFEVRIDGGIWDAWEGGARPNENEAAAVQNDGEAVPIAAFPDDNDAAPAPVVQDNRAAQQAQAGDRPGNQRLRPVMQGERSLSFSPTAVAENIIGALIFPTLAELSGVCLKLILPRTWTLLPAATAVAGDRQFGLRQGLKGLLQQKWGRSLIGGCLLVVFKDALLLYARWKMAQMHRNRRVLDYDRSKARQKAKT